MATPSAQYERMTKDQLAQLVAEAAQRLREEHDLCDEVNEELRSMGLGHLVKNKRVVLIEVEVEGDNTDNHSVWAAAMEAGYDSDKVRVEEGELYDY